MHQIHVAIPCGTPMWHTHAATPCATPMWHTHVANPCGTPMHVMRSTCQYSRLARDVMGARDMSPRSVMRVQCASDSDDRRVSLDSAATPVSVTSTQRARRRPVRLVHLASCTRATSVSVMHLSRCRVSREVSRPSCEKPRPLILMQPLSLRVVRRGRPLTTWMAASVILALWPRSRPVMYFRLLRCPTPSSVTYVHWHRSSLANPLMRPTSARPWSFTRLQQPKCSVARRLLRANALSPVPVSCPQ
mmetsp:Transcript_6219/g.13583  ORF Transcript_6219/g.13583 Transcript_6219/m.13583 type:complete len:247 (-) Transcript_6219:2223-2963(-)